MGSLRMAAFRAAFIAFKNKRPLAFNLISRYGVLGTAVFPPILFYWYKWLDGRFVGTAVKTIATKVVLDQAVSAPIILGLFYIGMSLMEGRPDIFQELREKFVDTFKFSCAWWMPAQAVNFTFCPNQYRVVFIGVASFVWVNILCCIKRGTAPEGLATNEEKLDKLS